MIWGYILLSLMIIIISFPVVYVLIRCYDEYKDRQQEDSSR